MTASPRIVAVHLRLRLTIDAAEATVLERILQGRERVEFVVYTCRGVTRSLRA